MSINYDFQIITVTPANDSSNNNNELLYQLPYPIKLQDYDVALASLYLYYSWGNISAEYGNNTLRYIWVNGTTYTVVMPDGYYSLSDINNFLHLTMESNGHYLIDANSVPVYYISLVVNPTYYRNTLTCLNFPAALPVGWTNPNVPQNTFAGLTPRLIVPAAVGSWPMSKTIGYAPGTYPPVPIGSEFQSNGNAAPQISPVNAVNVNLNCVNSSYFNASVSTIYTFSANVAYGAQIQIEPKQLLWFKAVDSLINKIDMTLTDQDGNPLIMNDPNIVLNVYLRRRSK